jgi:hypothetical protein
LGRFLTRDTIGYQGGPNLYAYCGSNPITREDPAGTDDADSIFPESQSGGTDVVGPLTNKVHELSSDGIQAGQLAMDANPIGAADEARTGTNASGAKISWGQRTLLAFSVFGGAIASGISHGAEAAGAGASAMSAEGKALLDAAPTGSALKEDIIHRSASFMRSEAAENGTHFKIVGNDGVTRTLTQIQAEINGVIGRFEYIVDPDAAKGLTHQRAVECGTINGIPNKP